MAGPEYQKAKLDDKDKVEAVDHAPQQPAKGTADDDDRLGGLARTTESATSSDPSATDERAMRDNIERVQQSFHWLNDAAQGKIEALRSDLKKAEEPPWYERLVEAALDVALLAGAGAGGEFLAMKFVPKDHEVGKEFVKTLFEEGINTGVEAGKAKLGSGHSDPVDPFIESQKEGVRAMHMENQASFISVGRHKIQTNDQALALRRACSPENVEQAARQQAAATRNAWVSYLAQAKFGALGKTGPTGELEGPTTTNMQSQERRDNTNKWAPNSVPDDAPTLKDAILGDVPGVLEILAKLPAIERSSMSGKPEVTLAILNGVNETIRDAYTKRPLAGIGIPVQIVAKVEGGLPDFTINVDEKGELRTWLKHSQGQWLRARATVDHPETASKDDYEKEQEGLALLLGQLIPESVAGKSH